MAKQIYPEGIRNLNLSSPGGQIRSLWAGGIYFPGSEVFLGPNPSSPVTKLEPSGPEGSNSSKGPSFVCHSLIFFAAKLDKSLDPPLGVRVQRGFRSSWAAYPAARWTYGGKQPHAVVFEMSMSSRLLGPPPCVRFKPGFRSSWAAYPAARWTYGGKQPRAVVLEMSMSARLLPAPRAFISNQDFGLRGQLTRPRAGRTVVSSRAQ